MSVTSPAPLSLPATGLPREAPRYRLVVALLWLYFFLLIFEGALRKWILPQFSAPLLIVRDPVVILIYLSTLMSKGMLKSELLSILYIIAGLALGISLIVGESLLVTLYGFRSDFLHLPLIFVMGEVLTLAHVRRFGAATLMLAIPTAAVMVMQFDAPPDAVINRGTLGSESQQITAAMGHIRPAAFFSYNTGAGQFLALLMSFIMGGLLAKSFRPWLIYAAAVSLAVCAAVSGSRTTIVSLGFVLAFFLIIGLVKPKAVGRMPVVVLAMYLLWLTVPKIAAFQEGLEVLQTRTQQAFEGESLLDRTIYTFVPHEVPPFLGYGLGAGTNVGAASLTGTISFLLAEGEWPRALLESGLIIGGAFMLWRVVLIVVLLITAFHSVRLGQFQAWLINAAALPLLFLGNFGQATSLGFAVFCAGLSLGANNFGELPASPSDPQATPEEAAPQAHLTRGQSAYAERLHAGRN